MDSFQSTKMAGSMRLQPDLTTSLWVPFMGQDSLRELWDGASTSVFHL